VLLAASGGMTEAGRAAHPCFFTGLLTDPAVAAAGMLAVAAVARARYCLPASVLSLLRDPVVTCNEDRLRFESFSSTPQPALRRLLGGRDHLPVRPRPHPGGGPQPSSAAGLAASLAASAGAPGLPAEFTELVHGRRKSRRRAAASPLAQAAAGPAPGHAQAVVQFLAALAGRAADGGGGAGGRGRPQASRVTDPRIGS
jgi:hypothetical protein